MKNSLSSHRFPAATACVALFFACAPSGASPSSCGGVKGNAGRLSYSVRAGATGPSQRADRALAPGVVGAFVVTGSNQPEWRTTAADQGVVRTVFTRFRSSCVTTTTLADGGTSVSSDNDAGPGACMGQNQRFESTEEVDLLAVAAGETDLVSVAPTGEVDRLRVYVAPVEQLALYQSNGDRWFNQGEVPASNDGSFSVFARQANTRIVVTTADIRVTVGDPSAALLLAPRATEPAAEITVASGDVVRVRVLRPGARSPLTIARESVSTALTLVTQ
ncbi:MAG: hypothetical protein JNK05_37630 [Myxococcales bacterium]|nr:hypothetical protein [Myxococcales bacterium]